MQKLYWEDTVNQTRLYFIKRFQNLFNSECFNRTQRYCKVHRKPLGISQTKKYRHKRYKKKASREGQVKGGEIQEREKSRVRGGSQAHGMESEWSIVRWHIRPDTAYTSRAEGRVKLNRSLDDLNITFFYYFYL